MSITHGSFAVLEYLGAHGSALGDNTLGTYERVEKLCAAKAAAPASVKCTRYRHMTKVAAHCPIVQGNLCVAGQDQVLRRLT